MRCRDVEEGGRCVVVESDDQGDSQEDRLNADWVMSGIIDCTARVLGLSSGDYTDICPFYTFPEKEGILPLLTAVSSDST